LAKEQEPLDSPGTLAGTVKPVPIPCASPRSRISSSFAVIAIMPGISDQAKPTLVT
jgi:hypothetical protein